MNVVARAILEKINDLNGQTTTNISVVGGFKTFLRAVGSGRCNYHPESNTGETTGRGAPFRLCRVFFQDEQERTGASSNFAIVGEGFFNLKPVGPNGETSTQPGFWVTRAGDFGWFAREAQPEEEDQPGKTLMELCTSDGRFSVLDTNGKRILEELPAHFDPSRLRVVSLKQPDKLRDMGFGIFLYNVPGDEPQLVPNPTVERGALSVSTTDSCAPLRSAQSSVDIAVKCGIYHVLDDLRKAAAKT